MKSITFIDVEVSSETEKIVDFGAVKSSGETMHDSAGRTFMGFIKGTDFLCGHNIIRHDLKYLKKSLDCVEWSCLSAGQKVIDTLHWSPLLFPKRPYHKLVKDDKLQADEWNNPLNDAKKARDLFYDEAAAFHNLPHPMKRIFYELLKEDCYGAFFKYLDFEEIVPSVEAEIFDFFNGEFCTNADVGQMVKHHPAELSHCLAIIHAAGEESVTPGWVLHQYPEVNVILHKLREIPCGMDCVYCRERLNAGKALKRFFWT